MNEDHLTCEYRDGYAVVRLNRPDRLNALSHALVADLRRLIAEIDRDPAIRAIVLTGNGRGFCAGADLGGGPSDAENVVRRLYNPLIRQIVNQSTPVIAAVNGAAAGAGFSLSLAADLRVASESASFTLAFVRIGLVPDAGATWLLPRIVGAARATEMALLGRKVDAQTALAWNLVNEVVPDNEVVARACALAEQLVGLSSSVGRIRSLLQQSFHNDLETQLNAEATAQGVAQFHPDYAEARLAFTEKRAPKFR